MAFFFFFSKKIIPICVLHCHFIFHTNLQRSAPLLSGCRVTHAVDTRVYKHAWAYVCTCTHRQIRGKYSFVLHLVRASCSRINTFHGTGAYRSFIARFLPLFFSSGRDSLFLLSRSWFALLLYFVLTSCHGCI